jgi:hypothetical protein
MDDRDRTERFSLGTILAKLKIVSREEIEEALRIQSELTRDERLGELLVARGRLTREQLELALAAQRDLRSTDKTTRALAAANLSKISSERVLAGARELRVRANEVRRGSDRVGRVTPIGSAVLTKRGK